MLYALRLEAIGDDVLYERRMHRRHGLVWQPRRLIEVAVRASWVAPISGVRPDGALVREFLWGRRDYSEANRSGSRGIWMHYLLDDGVYEVRQQLDWTSHRRYFLRVCDGQAREGIEALLEVPNG